MIPPILASIIPSLIDVVMGKKKTEAAVTEYGHKLVQEKTKGLIGSKTARTAAGALMVKIPIVLALPVPEWLKWTLVGAFLLEFLAQLYLRVITKDPV